MIRLNKEIEEIRESNDSSMEVEVIAEDGRQVECVVSEQRSRKVHRVGANLPEFEAKTLGCRRQQLLNPLASDLAAANMKVDSLKKMLSALSLNCYLSCVSTCKKLLETVWRGTYRLSHLDYVTELREKRRSLFQSLCDSLRPAMGPVEDVSREPFIPLAEEDEPEVERAFSAKQNEVLVIHQNAAIEITGEIFQCLRPSAWLNDEVINLYLELLKERENREPHKFLKCHFFNTFFYTKLTGGKTGYDYIAVRRWTSKRKLGYGLIECDKIFVPIHKEIHWCLAIINKKDEKLQYLDSLKNIDYRVLKMLARYFVDEVRDKSGKDLNLTSWKLEYVDNLPAQKNRYDCGMFMLKYIDFHSRGLGVCFNQEHMPYFRLRTAKEILRLRAD